ncbi:Cof-type HAD-IIB family hydrolase [Clostridia bacterium OttesenSCG-928-O13]|nr:Cof-type HAD-IIB family hydrolase [Clostridia bacterium OttesenSCG-928-O13]
MSESIGDILVVSDMDGTLLNGACELLSCNLETIRLFKALGGRFTLATGRYYASIAMYPQLAELLEPAITANGCVIYDFQENKAKKSTVLSHLAARQVLRDVQEQFPAIGSMVFGADMKLYQINPSACLQALIRDEKMSFSHKPVENLPDEWIKIIYAAERSELDEVEAYLGGRTYPGVYFVSTGDRYLEVLPKGVSKGSALRELCDLLGVSLKNTYAIGDYYNDIEILKTAGHAVVMGNAPSDIKEMADEVIGTCEEGAVGQFLYSLIQKYAGG